MEWTTLVAREWMSERERERDRKGEGGIEEGLKYTEKRWQVEETRSHLHIVCRMLRVYRTELPALSPRLLSRRALVPPPQIHPRSLRSRSVVYARHETNA